MVDWSLDDYVDRKLVQGVFGAQIPLAERKSETTSQKMLSISDKPQTLAETTFAFK
jgi:hypothetical protein